MAEPKQYSSENIKEWVWYEHIRKRPGMYVGALNNHGFIKNFEGLLANNFARYEANYVLIELQDKNSIRLRFENILHEIPDNWAVKYEKTHVPLSIEAQVFNALSKQLSVRFYDKNGDEILYQKFEKGILKEGEIKGEKLDMHAIEVHFQLDEEVWNDKFEWNKNYIIDAINKFAYLHKDRKFEIRYTIDDEPCKIIYHFKNGLKDRIDLEILNGLGGSYFDTWFTEEIGDFSIEVAFAFKSYTVDAPFLKSYVNDYYTHEDGTHADGLLKGLTYGVMKYFQKHELTQQYKISEKGMKESLVAALNIRMEEPVFSGCVKNKLASPEVIEPIANYVADLLFKKIETDEEATHQLIRKFKVY